jgi:hypothetical protein
MKKFAIIAILTLVAVCMMFGQAKQGGFARQAAMGGSQAGYGVILNPFIMDDPALLFLNPAYQSNYKDYFWANIGGGRLAGNAYTESASYDDGYGRQNAGVAFQINDQFTVGTILSHDPSAISMMGELLQYQSTDLSSANYFEKRSPVSLNSVNNFWEVLAAYHANALDLGLGISYGWSNNEYKYKDAYTFPVTLPTLHDSTVTYDEGYEGSANVLGLRAGLLYDLGNGSMLDASATFRFDNITDKRNRTPYYDSVYYSPGNRYSGEYSVTGTEMQFNARMKMKVSNKFNFVPYAMLGLISGEPKEDAAPLRRGYEAQYFNILSNTRKVNGTVFGIGAGGEVKTQSFYLAGGVSFQYAKVEMKTDYTSRYVYAGEGYQYVYDTTYNAKETYSYTAIPVINLGCEWNLTDWLTARMGYYRAIGSLNEKYEYTMNENYAYTAGATTTQTHYTDKWSYEYDNSLAHSAFAIGGLTPSSFDGLVTMGVGFKFGGFALDATVSDEALRRGLGLIGSSDGINTFGYMTASYCFGE